MRTAALLLSLFALSAAAAQEREPAGDAARIRGSVRLESGGPLAGHPVGLYAGNVEHSATVTDEGGLFDLPRVTVEKGLVSVRLPHAPGLRVVKKRQNVGEGTRWLEFVVRAVPTARVQGLVLEDSTGLPIPHSAVKIYETRGGPTEVCLTDAGGRFLSETEFASGQLSVYPWDNEGHRTSGSRDFARVEHVVRRGAGGPATVVCRLKPGERFDLDFAPRPGTAAEDHVVQIRPRGDPPCAPIGGGRQGRVHPGEPPWTRPDPPRVAGRPETLYLLSKDGLAGASIDLPSEPGRPLALDLRPLGGLRVHVRESVKTPPRHYEVEGERVEYGSAQVMAGVGLHFTPLGGEDVERRAFRVSAQVGRDQFFGWVEPGRWTCEVRSPYYPEQSSVVDVLPGAPLPLEVVLDPATPTGTIRIQVADPAGDVDDWDTFDDAPDLSATVRSRAQGGASYAVMTTAFCGSGIDAWFRRVEREGRFVYEAVLEDVPEGTYGVSVISDKLLVRSTAETRPGETAQFTYRRPVPEEAYRLAVLDAATGDAVSYYSVLPLERGGGFALSQSPAEGGVHAYGLPVGDPVRWCVLSHGYRRAYGDRSDFEAREEGYLATVELEPGFGLRLFAALPDGSAAAGVELRFAGKSVTTDIEGRAWLSSDEPRPELRLEAGAGWELAGGDVDAEGRFTGLLCELRATVERAP